MERRRVALLGKGSLAKSIGSWFVENHGYELDAVVPVLPEPSWTGRLGQHFRSRPYLGARVLDHHDELEGRYDLVFSCFYDKILPPEFIGVHGLCVNVHLSPLPRYRGMRPVNWALKNGETSHGATIHRIDEGIDSGPIYGQVTFPIFPDDTVRSVWRRAEKYAWYLFKDVMPRLWKIEPAPQDGSLATVHYSRQNEELGEYASW